MAKSDFIIEFISDSVINALRILKKSTAFRNVLICHVTLSFDPYPAVAISDNNFDGRILTGEKCNILENEIDEIKKIFSTISDKKIEQRFIIAINRLSFGIERKKDEDKIVDFMIGLEALYLFKHEYQKKMKISLRCAHTLDNRITEDFEFLKKIYKIRSEIVHGDKLPVIDNTDIIKIENILRKSIKLWIKNESKFSRESLNKIFSKN